MNLYIESSESELEPIEFEPCVLIVDCQISDDRTRINDLIDTPCIQKFRYIRIKNCINLSDTALEYLLDSSSRSLKRLELINTMGVTEKSLRHLAKKFNSLEQLSLELTSITTISGRFGTKLKFEHLKELYLSNNPKLAEIRIRGDNLRFIGIMSCHSLTDLTLRCHQCSVDDIWINNSRLKSFLIECLTKTITSSDDYHRHHFNIASQSNYIEHQPNFELINDCITDLFEDSLRDNEDFHISWDDRSPEDPAGIPYKIISQSVCGYYSGSTSIKDVATHGFFREATRPTIGIDFGFRTVWKHGMNIRLSLRDVPAVEMYHSSGTRPGMEIYCKKQNAHILIFDWAQLSKQVKTFDRHITKIRNADPNFDDHPKIILINRFDMPLDNNMNLDEVEKIFNQFMITYNINGWFKVSAKNRTGIDQAFDFLAMLCVEYDMIARSLIDNDPVFKVVSIYNSLDDWGKFKVINTIRKQLNLKLVMVLKQLFFLPDTSELLQNYILFTLQSVTNSHNILYFSASHTLKAVKIYQNIEIKPKTTPFNCLSIFRQLQSQPQNCDIGDSVYRAFE